VLTFLLAICLAYLTVLVGVALVLCCHGDAPGGRL